MLAKSGILSGTRILIRIDVRPSRLDFFGVLPTLPMLQRKAANFRVVLAHLAHRNRGKVRSTS
jgi:hypothetical protein